MSDSGKRISRCIGLVALSGSLSTLGFMGVSALASASTYGSGPIGNGIGAATSATSAAGSAAAAAAAAAGGGGGCYECHTTTTHPVTSTTVPVTHVTVPVTHVTVPVHHVTVPVTHVTVPVHHVVSAAPARATLPFTGINSLWMTLGALMLVLMGVALLQFTRPDSTHSMSLRRQLATIWGRSTD